MTPLHLAARFKNCGATVVSTLIEAGANVNALESHAESPLHFASARNPAVVPVLIAAGCKVNLLGDCEDSPLLLAAVFSKDRPAVAALMAAGADPHLGDGGPFEHAGVSDEMIDYIRSLSE